MQRSAPRGNAALIFRRHLPPQSTSGDRASPLPEPPPEAPGTRAQIHPATPTATRSGASPDPPAAHLLSNARRQRFALLCRAPCEFAASAPRHPQRQTPSRASPHTHSASQSQPRRHRSAHDGHTSRAPPSCLQTPPEQHHHRADTPSTAPAAQTAPACPRASTYSSPSKLRRSLSAAPRESPPPRCVPSSSRSPRRTRPSASPRSSAHRRSRRTSSRTPPPRDPAFHP